MEYIVLNNGVKCPVIGIGTFMLSPVDAENSVREALKMGYSLVDTANAYVNERAVGRGMKASGVQREDIFLSTKLWPSEYENPNAVDETLARLGVDYVDFYLVHNISWRRRTKRARRRPSAFPTSRASTSRRWRRNGRSCPSLSRWRHTRITLRRSCASSWISTVSN